jgi:hypothetical protein
MKIVEAQRVEVLNYAAAMDPEGSTMVSSISAAMH